MTAITAVALPFMALGQTTEEPQQTKETQTTAPKKAKKMRPGQNQSNPQAKPETGTNVKGRAHDISRNHPRARSSTSQAMANESTRVHEEEFRTRHSDVFSLGRHPKEFFIQRYGAKHFRLIGNEYFVFVDGCWVAVDVDGFVFAERVICAGDPEFVEVVD
jgi:hypothetical protein